MKYFMAVLGAAFLLAIIIELILPLRFYGYVKKYCQQYGVKKSTALAVIWTESKFDVDAVSSAGACGLMRIMPSTAEWLCAELNIEYDKAHLFDAEYNIRLGVYYLSYLQKSFKGDYVIAAYNAGEGNVRLWLESGGEIRFAETENYVKKVKLLSRLYAVRVGKD